MCITSLLNPAYVAIGPQTCVGLTEGWKGYAWPPSLAFIAVILIFLLDLAAERYIEHKYDLPNGHVSFSGLITSDDRGQSPTVCTAHITQRSRSGNHVATQRKQHNQIAEQAQHDVSNSNEEIPKAIQGTIFEERPFQTQMAAFLILEFGIVFHSVIIGLNLGAAGNEFSMLYPVLVFHQSFEGLGIGARLSIIPLPKRWHWLPWVLCMAYGLTTPIAVAVGLGVRTTYNPGSFTANVVSGVLDSISAGILIYTGLVELLARDFLFDPNRTRDNKKLTFMVVSVLLGAALMALLGKWA